MKNKKPMFLAAAFLAPSVFGATPLVLNPSFESNYNETFPHYGSIDSWIGGSGVNESGGPFHNGATPIPDGVRVGFIQGSASLAQDIGGLEPGKNYWIQYWYDARNCCGGTVDLLTFFGDVELEKIGNVRPAVLNGKPYASKSVSFMPESDFGTLAFRTVASGDATAVLDAVTIVQRDTNNVVVMNPSFEASGVASFPGEARPIAGWAVTGQAGVDDGTVGQADNGTIPEQAFAAFIQGAGSLTQTVPNLISGNTYEVSLAYNAKSGTSPRIRVKAGATVLFEEDVSPVTGGLDYRRKTASFVANDLTTVLSIEQVKESGDVLLVDEVRVKGATQKPLPPLQIGPAIAEIAPGQKVTATITVPVELLAIKDATLKFRSSNTNVIKLANADAEGVVSLAYLKDGTNAATIEVQAVGRGTARLEVADSAGLTVPNDLAVNVVTSFVRNPSFEGGPTPGGVGYGGILAWNAPATSGINLAAGPFHDNGTIPDRLRVAFVQNSGVLSQEISGLTPGENYWLQFYYNVRNCCGGSMDLEVRFGGTVLTNILQIFPAAEVNSYWFAQLNFTPTVASGMLELAATAQGDATLLLDAVTIVQREKDEIVIRNPSFEASGSPANVGYVQPANLAGWEGGAGGRGINVNGAGPFSDNGVSSDQDLVAFLQNAGSSLSQTVSGLQAGQEYTLIFDINGRTGGGPELTAYRASLDDVPLIEEEISPVGGQNPYYERYLTFMAAGAESVLKFEHTTPTGDHTLLLDNVRIVKGKVVPSPRLRVKAMGDGTIEIRWSALASTFVLQSTTALPGGWANVAAQPFLDGNDNVLLENASPGRRFYRLRAP